MSNFHVCRRNSDGGMKASCFGLICLDERVMLIFAVLVCLSLLSRVSSLAVVLGSVVCIIAAINVVFTRFCLLSRRGGCLVSRTLRVSFVPFQLFVRRSCKMTVSDLIAVGWQSVVFQFFY